MKSNFFNKVIASALLLLLLASCSNNEKQSGHAHHAGTEVVPSGNIVDSLQASGSAISSDITVIEASRGTRILSVELPGKINYDSRQRKVVSSRVAGRIERLMVNYNFQRVSAGQKIMEIYSPELAAAQREAIFLQENDDEAMLEKAKTRLRLLGMSRADIQSVLNSKKVLYNVPVYSTSSGYLVESTAAAPSSPATSPSVQETMNVMEVPEVAPSVNSNRELKVREGQYVKAGESVFTVYETDHLVAEFSIDPELSNKIEEHQKLLFYPQHDRSQISIGRVGLIEPVLRSSQQFNILRVYLNNKQFQPGELVTAKIPVLFSKGWWVPSEAVWSSGSEDFVFRKEQNIFKPYPVEKLVEVNGQALIATDLSGWQLASNAAYLADSESFIFSESNPQRYEE